MTIISHLDETLDFKIGPCNISKNTMLEAEEYLQKYSSVSHRSKEFATTYENLKNNVRRLYNLNSEWDIVLLSSATEGWANSVSSFVSDNAEFLVNGKLSESYYKVGSSMFDNLTKISTISLADSGLPLFALHTESTTGEVFDYEELKKIKARNKEKFVCLDITGSDPFAALRYIKLCDVFYFSVQKYFSLLPGLCVFCMNNNARKISEYIDENFSRNKFLNLVDHLAFAAKNQTLYTINTMGVYLFNKQLDRLLNRYNEYKYAHVVNFNYLKNRVDASETLKYMIPQKSLSSNIIKILCSKSYQEIKNVLHTNNVLVSSLNEEDNNSCSFRINNYMIRKKSDFHKLIDLIE